MAMWLLSSYNAPRAMLACAVIVRNPSSPKRCKQEIMHACCIIMMFEHNKSNHSVVPEVNNFSVDGIGVVLTGYVKT